MVTFDAVVKSQFLFAIFSFTQLYTRIPRRTAELGCLKVTAAILTDCLFVCLM